MKYIDAEKLKELVDEKWKELADKNVKVGGGKWDAEISTYLSVLRLIDSLQQEQDLIIINKKDWETQEQFRKNKKFGKPLQQEQPVIQNGKFVFPKYLYARTKDNKTIDMSYVPQDITAIEYIRNDFVEQEQPEADLEKEIDACWQNWLSPSNQKEVEGVLPKTEFAMYARHFAEWGAEHLKK